MLSLPPPDSFAPREAASTRLRCSQLQQPTDIRLWWSDPSSNPGAGWVFLVLPFSNLWFRQDQRATKLTSRVQHWEMRISYTPASSFASLTTARTHTLLDSLLRRLAGRFGCPCSALAVEVLAQQYRQGWTEGKPPPWEITVQESAC